jgi:hypothetical protein
MLLLYQDQDGNTISECLDDHKYGLKNALISTNRRLGQLKFSELQEKYVVHMAVALFNVVAFCIIIKRTRILSLLWSWSWSWW